LDSQLTVGSLFSGIGGLDLGLERAGMRVIWQSEIDDYASRVLKKHWPEVPNYGDIKKINWGTVERPDVICGGYPCQPFSTAGKRRGTDDPRHLWPWVLDAISELRPRYAIMENVRGHLSMGGVAVIGDLASIGYDAEWRVISAASVGANHRRDRIIIVAYPNEYGSPSNSFGRGVRQTDEQQQTRTDRSSNTEGRGRSSEQMADANSEGLERRGGFQERETEPKRFDVFSASKERYQEWTGGSWWEFEPDVGRVAYGVPARVDRLKGLGNAVVPQVAEIVGRLVVEHSTQ
jgi:DNA (cytosine-5)-methyltransferase 1